jgi:GxxExxY protein
MKCGLTEEALLREYPHQPLTRSVIGAAIEVHRVLGPGLLESAYRKCLAHELLHRDLDFRLEVPIPLRYKQAEIDCGFRADIIVGDQLLVELKSVERLLLVHDAQVLTYLKLCGMKVGLLINFNVSSLRNGIKRLIR